MPHRARRRTYHAGAICLALLASLATCSPRKGRGFHMRPIPPPCNVDGVFLVDAQRTGSSGSVCSLQDLSALHGEITIQRTGPATAQVHRKGKYSLLWLLAWSAPGSFEKPDATSCRPRATQAHKPRPYGGSPPPRTTSTAETRTDWASAPTARLRRYLFAFSHRM